MPSCCLESQSLHRETLSAPKVYHNKPKYKTEDQFMSLSADIHRRGDNQLRVETPPYRDSFSTLNLISCSGNKELRLSDFF
jgi:hypothetical protein